MSTIRTLVSGSDTVSATYVQGKLRGFKKLHESNLWRDSIHIVDDYDVNREYITEIREKFYMKLYGKLFKKRYSFDHLHKIMYTMPKCITNSGMLPTNRAF